MIVCGRGTKKFCSALHTPYFFKPPFQISKSATVAIYVLGKCSHLSYKLWLAALLATANSSLLLHNCCARRQLMFWNAACLTAEAQKWAFLPNSAYGHVYYAQIMRSWSDRLHYLLLSKQQVLVSFSATSQLLCLKIVDDLECCMLWPCLCWSSNVSIFTYIY